jgi:hypothetical protein
VPRAKAKPRTKLPRLAADFDSIAAYVAAVNASMRSGRINVTIGRELLKGAATMSAVVRAKHGLTEMAEYESKLRRMEKAQLDAKAAEVANRYNGGDEVSEYDAPVDPDEHGSN